MFAHTAPNFFVKEHTPVEHSENAPPVSVTADDGIDKNFIKFFVGNSGLSRSPIPCPILLVQIKAEIQKTTPG
jgi:hypothetical protein